MVGTDGPLEWKTSSRCGEAGACVEIAFGPDEVHVRRGDDPVGAVLTISGPAWQALVAGIKAGDFDLD